MWGSVCARASCRVVRVVEGDRYDFTASWVSLPIFVGHGDSTTGLGFFNSLVTVSDSSQSSEC